MAEVSEGTPVGGTPPTGGPEGGEKPTTGFVGTSTGEPLGTPPSPSGGEPGAGGGDGGSEPGAGGTPPKTGDSGAGDGRRVVGHGGEMPPEAVSERVARERRKWLREEYGTDDEKEIVRIRSERKKQADQLETERKELAQFRTKEEERRRAEMTELERAKADIAKKDRELQAVRNELNGVKTGLLADKQEVIVKGALLEHLDEEDLEVGKLALAKHFMTLSDTAKKEFGERHLHRWAKDFVKKHPKLAKKPVVKTGDDSPPIAHPRRRAPVSNSNEDPKKKSPPPVPKSGDPSVAAGKTVKPGQANTMSKREVDKLYREKYGRPKPW